MSIYKYFSVILPERQREKYTKQTTHVFQLYTRSNQNTGQRLVADNPDTIRRSLFDKHRPTKIVIHGFLESTSAIWFKVSIYFQSTKIQYISALLGIVNFYCVSDNTSSKCSIDSNK